MYLFISIRIYKPSLLLWFLFLIYLNCLEGKSTSKRFSCSSSQRHEGLSGSSNQTINRVFLVSSGFFCVLGSESKCYQNTIQFNSFFWLKLLRVLTIL